MPYQNTAELPEDVKRSLPYHGQEIYMEAYNSATKQYEDEGGAHATAWSAVKEKYEKDDEGDWVEKD